MNVLMLIYTLKTVGIIRLIGAILISLGKQKLEKTMLQVMFLDIRMLAFIAVKGWIVKPEGSMHDR